MEDKIISYLINKDIKSIRENKKSGDLDFSFDDNFYLKYCAKNSFHKNFFKLVKKELDFSFNNFEIFLLLLKNEETKRNIDTLKYYLSCVDKVELIYNHSNVILDLFNENKTLFLKLILAETQWSISNTKAEIEFSKNILHILKKSFNENNIDTFSLYFSSFLDYKFSSLSEELLEYLLLNNKNNKHFTIFFNRTSEHNYFCLNMTYDFVLKYKDTSYFKQLLRLFKKNSYHLLRTNKDSSIEKFNYFISFCNKNPTDYIISDVLKKFIELDLNTKTNKYIINYINDNNIESSELSTLMNLSIFYYNFDLLEYFIKNSSISKTKTIHLNLKDSFQKFTLKIKVPEEKVTSFFNQIFELDYYKNCVDIEDLETYLSFCIIRYELSFVITFQKVVLY